VNSRDQSGFGPYLEKLREIEFVKALRFAGSPGQSDIGIDGVLTIETPRGKFAFSVEHKNSYLDRTVLNAFIVQAKHYAGKRPLLLFARYIPRPSADRLVQSGVNFLDQMGNIHLALGDNYVRTVLGNKEAARAIDSKSVTPTKVQLLFTLAGEEKRDWTVRELAEASGVSKSNVAKLRRQMIDQGILQKNGSMFDLRYWTRLEDDMIRGYEQVLRPKLLFNRFRSEEKTTDLALGKLRTHLIEHSVRWSLTGGAAAYQLQRFYKGADLVLFVENPTQEMARQLRLLPDKEGTITLLRAFGTLPFWRKADGNVIAHPWLIYAELMRSADPRAHEAANELRGEFLKK
jgi:hypothetical protein